MPGRPVAKTKTQAKRKPSPDTGRLDILASRLLQEYGKRNPTVGGFYAEFQPELDAMLRQYLGPRNPSAAKLRQFIIDGNRVLQARRAAQLRRGTAA